MQPASHAPLVVVSPLRLHGTHQILEVRINGSFELESLDVIVKEVQAHLDEVPPGGVLAIYGQDLTFMNSTSIGTIITWHLDLAARGARVILVDLQPNVLDVLHTTGITQLLGHGPTLDDALDSPLPSPTPPPA